MAVILVILLKDGGKHLRILARFEQSSKQFVYSSGTADFPYLIDPLTGLTNALGKDVKIQSSTDDWDLAAAAKTAKGADIAFVFSNADSGEEYITVDGNKGDRNNLTLWHNGDNLVSIEMYKRL